MIEKLLEAYEGNTRENGTLWINLRKMNVLTKVIFFAVIGGWVIVLILCLFIQSKGTFIAMISYVVILYIYKFVFERVRHSQWKLNLEKYNEDLNNIAEILKTKEFNSYEKNKIKQLIYKYYQSIEQHDKENTRRGNEVKEFIYTYIVPLIAFFAGKINAVNATDSEWVVLCIAIIIIVIGGKICMFFFQGNIRIVKLESIREGKAFCCKTTRFVR